MYSNNVVIKLKMFMLVFYYENHILIAPEGKYIYLCVSNESEDIGISCFLKNAFVNAQVEDLA